MKDGEQQTVTWHVDDLKSSHVNPKANDEFAEWLEKTHGSDDLRHVKVVRGKVHDCLAMIMDFTQESALKLDVRHCVKGMIEEFPCEIKATTTAPWTEKSLKEAGRRIAEHLSHVRDERNVFVQESTTRH
jgi:hypothetical protein